MARKKILFPLMTVAAVLVSLFVAASPAQAHGYVSSPPSRQAQCAAKTVADCGDIVFEPQSVEAPKGSTQCNGGGARFAVLNDNSRPWRATSVGQSVAFTWTLTARHSTRDWEYFIGGTRVGFISDGGKQPPATVSHTVNLSGFSGRQTLLARWNINDTAMAFYACVDLQIGGGGGGNPPPPNNPPPNNPPPNNPPPNNPPPNNPPPNNPPPNNPPPNNPPPNNPGGTWAARTAYSVGSTVTYGGSSYRCRQAHTALAGWEPPNVPALWLPI